MSIHDGHRQRLKKRFSDNGLDSFEDHNALELLLFFAIPRGDVNPIAHKLMDSFGTLGGVFDAPIDELKKISGIGENSALLIKLVKQLCRRYSISSQCKNAVLNSTKAAGEYLAPYFFGEPEEVVYMVCLDVKYKVLSCKQIFRGTVSTANINVRKIVENALAYNSMCVILAHNHISGVALPSQEDKDTTRRVRDALKAVDILLADHIIIADGDFVSMADNGML